MEQPDILMEKAAEIIKNGGLVIAATETFYGIAADPFNAGSVKRIFEIKKRDYSNPLPLIASAMFILEEIVSKDDTRLLKSAKKLWPGSFTVLLHARLPMSHLLTGSTGKIAVRIPPACAALETARRSGGLITSTSANLSGKPAARTIEEISPELLKQVDMVMDSGPTPGGSPSTIVDIQEGRPVILRRGAVSEEAVMEVFNKFES